MGKPRSGKRRTATQSIRESALTNLAAEYKDASLLVSELGRAIDSFSGDIPEDSPVRYLRLSVGDAVMAYMQRVNKSQTVPALVRELENGGCIFGAIKKPNEIVAKAVAAYVRMGRLRWTDKKQTTVVLAT